MTRLEEQLAAETAERKRKAEEIKVKTDSDNGAEGDRIFAERQDEAGKCVLTEAQQAENVQNQIKRLRAEQELKSIQDGYKSYQDAVIQLSNSRKQLEEDRAKLPDITARETVLKQQEADIELRMSEVEKYYEEQKLAADNYYTSRRKEGDAHYQTSMANFIREYNEKTRILKEMSDKLDAKIELCNETAEPAGMLMAKDSRLIYNYLTNFIFPILNNGTLKMFGTFGGKLEITRQQAKILHDALYNDALILLKTAEKIKEN